MNWSRQITRRLPYKRNLLIWWKFGAIVLIFLLQLLEISLSISENFAQAEQKANSLKPSSTNNNTTHSQGGIPISQDRQERSNTDQIKKERIESPPANYSQSVREQVQSVHQETKPWGYSGLDLMNTGAAFWQNYSGELFFCKVVALSGFYSLD